MLIVLRSDATTREVEGVLAVVNGLGFRGQVILGTHRSTIAVLDNPGRVDPTRFDGLPGVQKVLHVTEPYRLAARDAMAEPTIIRLPGGLTIGEGSLVVIAGPCAVESESQILAAARAAQAGGAVILRGGAFKPRSSPYSFQGLGPRGIELLALARRETGLHLVTEALDAEGVDLVVEAADIIQIGARNMQNYPLLRYAARAGKPILLKRGMAATVEDLLLSAEYVLAEGQADVILCERGIRGFDPATRNLFDVGAIPLLHRLSHLPVFADPSHGTGHRDLVPAVAQAAVAAGADGLMLEVHANPAEAQSDGVQSLTPEGFKRLMDTVSAVAAAVGRSVARLEGVRT